nr:ribonuclease H-like domain-containing protein [Tanacetum cinerariifolium]
MPPAITHEHGTRNFKAFLVSDNDDLKQIDANDLDEMDLKWQMAMLTMRARRWNATTATKEVILQGSAGYDNQVFNSTVFDCDELISYESNVSVPTSLVHDRYKSGEGYHAVLPPYTGTFMPLKLDLVFHDAPTVGEIVSNVLNVKPSTTKPNKDLSQLNRPSAPIIEDWVSDSEDESKGEPMPTQKEPNFVQTSEHVKTTRTSDKSVEHPTQAENLRKDILKSRDHRHSWNRKACFVCKSVNHLIKDCDYYERKMVQKPVQVSHGLGPQKTLTFLFDVHGNPHQALKDKGVIDSGCSRYMTGYISYLSDFEEINGGYVAFGGNLKGGKITGKGKIRTCKLDFDDVYFVKELKFNLFSVSQMCNKKNNVLFTDTECVVLSSDFKLPDENHVLLRVLRENNIYNVDLKNIVPSGDLAYLFAKASLDESNIWHKRIGHINFKTMNKLVKGNLVRGLPSKVFENNHTCLACKKGKQHRASCKVGKVTESAQQYVLRPLWSTGSRDPQNTDAAAAFDDKDNEYKVHVSPSSSDNPKKHDEKAKKEAKGKSLVELSTGVKDLSDEFEEFFVNSTNRVNAASAPVTAVGPNSTNNTNSFNAVGPFDNAVSPTFKIGEKSSFVDPSQYPDDPDMPALEEIVYLDDEEDVGAEADFFNLETSITVSHIPTTRVYKDHPDTQIIGDLSSAPQTRSVTRMVKEQCGLTQIKDKDFHTCMFACFLSQEEPKRVHQALKDPSWIEAMQEEDADEDVTLVDAKEDMNADVQGRKVVELVTAAKLMTNVVTTAVTAAQVPKASAQRGRRGVVIQDPKETATASVIVHTEDEAFARQLKAELNVNINWDDVMKQVKKKEKQDNTVMRYQALKRKYVTEAQARKNMMVYLKNMAGFKIDFFKGMTYNDIRPIFEKHYNFIRAFLKKGDGEIKKEGSKRKVNDDDDVFTEATPLASKVPVVYYQIHHENNKPYYKIIRADVTHKLFLSFITLLKNFDREDLEML